MFGTTEQVVDFKIDGMITAKEYNALPFGRQIEHRRKIQEFQATAKTTWVSQKRKKRKAAIKEFLDLYDAKQYYYTCSDGPNVRDDSFQIWYK